MKLFLVKFGHDRIKVPGIKKKKINPDIITYIGNPQHLVKRPT